MSQRLPFTHHLLDAVTATTVGKALEVGDAEVKSIQFTRANHSAGSSEFIVEVSNDGTNYVTYNGLIDNVTNTNAEYPTRVGSVTLSSATSKVYSFDTHFNFRYIRSTVTETTDGTHTATLHYVV